MYQRAAQAKLKGELDGEWITHDRTKFATVKGLPMGVRVEMEAIALKKVSSAIVKTMTSRMKRLITSVDDNSEKQHINTFVDNELLSVDSLELRKYLNSINPDINMTAIATFPDGTEQEVAVELTAQFFWPSA